MSQKNGFDTNNYFCSFFLFPARLVDFGWSKWGFLKGGEVKLPKPAWLWTSMIIAFTAIIIFAIAIVIVHGGSQDPIVRNQAAFP